MNKEEKKRFGWSLGRCTFMLVLLASCLFLDESCNGQMNSELNWCVLLILLGTLISLTKIELPALVNGAGILISFIFLPRLLIEIVEYLVGMEAASLPTAALLLNILFCQLFIIFIFALTCNYRLAIVGGSSIIYLFALINHFVQAFRGTPFLPADILAVGTAADVAANYIIIVNQSIMLTAATLFCVLAICSKFHYKFELKNKWQRCVSCCLLVLVGIFGSYYYQTDIWNKNRVSVNFWNQLQGYQDNGSFLSFVMNSKYLSPQEPEGYSRLKAARILEDKEQSLVKTQEKPHIIMIMNESYADLQALGKLNTTIPYLETFENLDENVTKGNIYVSVLGGGTCNTEFEALTGHTMAFLPSGVMPYQQYIEDEQYSLVRILQSQGYEAIAFHPGEADSWCRDEVYPLLGFERFLTKEDMTEIELMRGAYVTDSCNYEEVIRLYEQRGEKKLFLFNVTIQNHGGYQLDTADIPQWVSIVGEKRYPQAEQYLSLMHASDRALAELLAYFSQEEEPVMVVFFGDHQPILEEELTESLLGDKLGDLTVEKVQQRHKCPFFIWSNYETESSWIEKMSVNYLPALVLEKAGLAAPPYYQFLLDLFAEYPVINGVGYIDKSGQHYFDVDKNRWPQELKDYAVLQYNLFFDINRSVERNYKVQLEEGAGN